MRLFSGLLVLLLIAVDGSASEAKRSDEGRFHFEKRIESNLAYLLTLPRDYSKDSSVRWPLVLYLHGSGERGTNLDLVTLHGPPKLVRQGHEFPFILLSPQCLPNERWQNDVLLGLIDSIGASYRVDTNRVYLTGNSMGGYGTWYLGMKFPGRFAALAPICGGGQILDVTLADNRTEELKKMPVWAFHGDSDTAVPPSESQQMVDALKKLGNPDVRFTLYPDVGHDAWTATYDNPEFYSWLVSQSREHRFDSKR